jgi:Polysaccharide deacetylase
MPGNHGNPQPPRESESDLLLLFTIDTEGSILRQRNPDPKRVVDELILGDYGTGAPGGIRLHMDLLEQYGFRGCFFVDVLLEYQFGQEALERVIEAIASRGHEIQLHVHDHHLAWSNDPELQALSRGMLGKKEDQFRRLMELSVNLFEKRTGSRPLAYRAGGFRIADMHFRVLEEFGIPIDTSLLVYSNSRVSDWMLTRTQPFRVGGVLEMPVTWLLLRDNRAAPQTRLFAPNATAGDPVSEMPGPGHGPPRVATYISHSFELMRADRDESEAAVDEFKRRLYAKLRPEAADLLLRQNNPVSMRIYDGTLNDPIVSAVDGILRRIADRPNARCTTYGEFLRVAERFWRDGRHEPVDPVPALDRPRGIATLTGTRVYTGALLSHLAASEPAGPGDDQEGEETAALVREGGVSWEGQDVAVIEPCDPEVVDWLRQAAARVETLSEPVGAKEAFDVVVWPEGFECCPSDKLGERLESAAPMLKPDGLLLMRVRTLGTTPPAQRGPWPPLAELLFSKHELRAAADGDHPEPIEMVAWDAATIAAWFTGQGFELVRERRTPRQPAELAAIARFSDKLGALDQEELRTSALDVTLRLSARMPGGSAGRRETPAPPAASSAAGEGAVGELAQRFGPITPEDAVLAVCPDTQVQADVVPRSRQAMSRRQLLRRLKETEPASSVTSLDFDALLQSATEPEAYDFIICTDIGEVEPEHLDHAADLIQRSLRPGGFLLVRIMRAASPPASVTTILLALLRAGLEVTDVVQESEFVDYRLVRPLDFAEIARFAGQA